MNADQQAMDRLGDFLKLLAQGCHVQVDDAIFAIGDGKTDPATPMKIMRSIDYFASKEEDRQWLGVTDRNLYSWLRSLLRQNYRVVHRPQINTEVIRHVRSVEL